MTDLVRIQKSSKTKYCYQMVDSEQKKDNIGNFDNKQDAVEVDEF